MTRRDDTDRKYEPMHGPGFAIRFKFPQPADKGLVERIKHKIQHKDGKY